MGARRQWITGSGGMGLLFLLFGSGVFALMWTWSVGTFQLWQEQTTLGETGIETQGVVLDRLARGNSSFIVDYEYEAPGGNGVAGVFSRSDYVDQTLYRAARAGSTVPVVYNPADPTQAMIAGNRWVQEIGPLLIFGNLMVLSSLLLGSYLLIVRPPLAGKRG